MLHFAEFYFGLGPPGGVGEGSRVFRVMCNGSTLLDNLDIYQRGWKLACAGEDFSSGPALGAGKDQLDLRADREQCHRLRDRGAGRASIGKNAGEGSGRDCFVAAALVDSFAKSRFSSPLRCSFEGAQCSAMSILAEAA